MLTSLHACTKICTSPNKGGGATYYFGNNGGDNFIERIVSWTYVYCLSAFFIYFLHDRYVVP